MSADDTSRDALVERVVDVIVMHRASDFLGTEISIVRSLAAAVVAAVVMPLVEESNAAIKRAEAAEAERDLLEAERDQALAELGRRK